MRAKPALAEALAVGALAALSGCVDLDVTRAPSAQSTGDERAQASVGSGYLCAVMTPSPVKDFFSPEWQRLTVAILTPSRQAVTKAVVDFSGFTKDGAAGAFPCIPVEASEPTVIAFEVEGHHGSVERVARETLAAVTDSVSSDLVPLKPTDKLAGGLEGVLMSNGVASLVLGGDGWCAQHPNWCFASVAMTTASTTLIVAPRGQAPRLRAGRLVDEKGAPAQGVAITLNLELTPALERSRPNV